MKSKIISVVVTTFNRPNKLLRFLQASLEQTTQPLEVIIVNDGSTADYSACNTFIQNHSSFLLVNQENAGVSTARNHGASKTKGQFIAFCDDDDFWLPNHIAILEKAIKSTDNTPGIYHTQRRELRGDQYFDPPIYDRPPGWTWQEHYITLGEMIPSATCMHRDIIEFSPFPEGIKYAEDHEQRLIAMSRYPCFPQPERTVVMDRTDESATNDKTEKIAPIYITRFKFITRHKTIRPHIRRSLRTKARYRWTSILLTHIRQNKPAVFLSFWLTCLSKVKSVGNLKTWLLHLKWHLKQ